MFENKCFTHTAGVDRQKLAAGAAPARLARHDFAAFIVQFPLSPPSSPPAKLGKTAISADCLAF
jgi:hypothetical protein